METNQQRMIITRNQDFLLRFATADDAALIVEYARKLGEFQHMLHAVTASEEDAAHLIAEKKGEVVFGYYQGKIVGFMYFTEKSSIFLGQNGLFIDMLFIDEEMRGKGFGKIFISFLAQLAVERQCQRLEWCCMDWNTPAIDFYNKLGAYRVEEMHTFRFTPENVKKVASMF